MSVEYSITEIEEMRQRQRVAEAVRRECGEHAPIKRPDAAVTERQCQLTKWQRRSTLYKGAPRKIVNPLAESIL